MRACVNYKADVLKRQMILSGETNEVILKMQGLNYLFLFWVSNPIIAGIRNRGFFMAYLISLLSSILVLNCSGW